MRVESRTAAAQADSVSRIAVLADDLTSAGDGAAPFRRAGHRARALLSTPETLPDTAEGVIAVDLGSRLLVEAEAVSRTERAARRLAGAELLLKTVDSTLRGHLAAEIRAAHAGSERRAVVIAPAFPAEGRTTLRGIQYVRGVPVHETEFARDPAHPVRTSDLADLLPEADLVDPDDLGGLPELIEKGGLFVCSAETDADLDRLVSSAPRPGDVLWVGSPGLAAALARRHPRTPATAPHGLPTVLRPLVAVGSAHPASRRQLELLRTRKDVACADSDDPGAAVEALRRASAPVLVAHTPDERRAATDSDTLTRDLALVVKELVADGSADGLVLTGGESAVMVLEALGTAGIELYDEPEPGIARGLLLGRPPIPVLIKAGGFGDRITLDRLCRLLVAGVDHVTGGDA
ncbi:four-carbon acid sugar kinase family protein [Streptomyces sp. ISL-36]|uniref:four-carbon acid sugar kinase family protein n=1 Tax=Streptomyces sp. ISL-36 TaxID=2819182 RepID=UPI001BE96046|nr:four-carbon acid sugar kinase family protein [Streptomyces sp. ISL-36]MBT2440651.1 four-carbon acid sugar kinase family protein [Streptomyces sp. ISL-36]